MVNGSVTYYAYDEQNQLLESRSVGKTYTYTYDAAGNIQTASDGTTTHNYTYDTGVWKDLLKYFDGGEITYDASGNPTSYYNGTRWNMTWAEGRRLVSASGDGKSLTFTYDSEGLRLTKKVGNTTYQYYYAGGKLMRQTDGTNTLDFFYDASGNPYALKYNNTLYYYITNLQGDVLHIVDTSGTPVVSYTYDPYGKLLTGTDSTLGNLNPLRYRGYVYDEETELYYLQSRYYDPATCRFINADGYASTGQGVLGHNMFAYCLNNPVAHADQSGSITVEVLVVSGVVVAVFICGLMILDGVAMSILDFLDYISTQWYYYDAKISFIYKSGNDVVAKADKEIRKKVKHDSKVRYWSATVRGDYVDIGRPLTFNQAVKEIQAGRSVFAVTWYEAKAVALAAGGESGRNNKWLEAEIDKGKENTPGYYWHYHPYNHSSGHVYYLFGEV